MESEVVVELDEVVVDVGVDLEEVDVLVEVLEEVEEEEEE